MFMCRVLPQSVKESFIAVDLWYPLNGAVDVWYPLTVDVWYPLNVTNVDTNWQLSYHPKITSHPAMPFTCPALDTLHMIYHAISHLIQIFDPQEASINSESSRRKVFMGDSARMAEVAHCLQDMQSSTSGTGHTCCCNSLRPVQDA